MVGSLSDRWLLISDLQIPFEHPKALEFCQYLQRHFKIPKENIINLGDEVDEYWASLYKHDPDATHTPTSEIRESIEKIKQWADAFPIMKICISNHGERWKRKAFESGIPSIMMRRYQEVLETPATWAWAKRWLIDAKRPFMCEHGDRFGGRTPHLAAALNNGITTAIGHHHSISGVEHEKTYGYDLAGIAGGSLIEFSKYVYHYARDAKRLPQIGTPVILDGGRMPIWCPL
jgi:hypothetical protein